MVTVEVSAETKTNWLYLHGQSAVPLIGTLAEVIKNSDALDPPSAWRGMTRAVRNIGRDGLAATAISALDTALWDLKAKLLSVSLASLFGRSGRNTDLRFRRLHQLQRSRTARSALSLGRTRWLPIRQNEDWFRT